MIRTLTGNLGGSSPPTVIPFSPGILASATIPR